MGRENNSESRRERCLKRFDRLHQSWRISRRDKSSNFWPDEAHCANRKNKFIPVFGTTTDQNPLVSVGVLMTGSHDVTENNVGVDSRCQGIAFEGQFNSTSSPLRPMPRTGGAG